MRSCHKKIRPFPCCAGMTRVRKVGIFVGLLLLPVLSTLAGEPPATTAREVEFFEKEIRPLLVTKCQKCHSEKKQNGGLRLTSREGALKGGETGPAVVPGQPAASLLWRAVEYRDDLQMPPDGKLPAEQLQHLRRWIENGAPWPAAPLSLGDDDWAETFRQRLDWWSLKPLRAPVPPRVSSAAWSREPVDCFLFHAQQQAGLQPAPPADPEVLLRRLSFVITGLPPSVELHARFMREWRADSEIALQRLVTELLASPHYGEHFARHWMDVVRYTDTYGYESDNPANGAWEYRDYLIRAFNADVPFAQLVREQLAGDLLPQPRINRQLALNESAIGPMFYHLGEHREGGSLMFNGIHQQMVDNKIDAFSKGFLALTLACTRCHSHKFEAVSQKEYYTLAALLMTPRWTARVIDAPGKNDWAVACLKQLREELRAEIVPLWFATAQNPYAWSEADLQQATLPPPPAAGKTEQPSRPREEVATPLARLLEPGGDVGKIWRELQAEWKQTRSRRIVAHANFAVLADFQRPEFPTGWVTEGDGITHGYVTTGTPLIALEGESLVSRLLPRGFHTHALSSKLPGAVRSPPQQAIPGSRLSVELAGGEYGGYQVVQANGFKSEEIGFFKSPELLWKTFTDPVLKNGVRQVTIEFATTALNPNFPPRIGLSAGFPPNDPGFDKRSWFSITSILGHEQEIAPADTLDHFAGLYAQPVPESQGDAVRNIRHWLGDAVRRWCAGTPAAADVRLLNWLLSHRLLPNRAPPGSKLALLVAQYRAVEQALPFPRTVTGMDERQTTRALYPINIRGDVDTQGELVSPDFLQMFAGKNQVNRSAGSGRLELAESLLQPNHPLTARVYVNRVWQWVFGTGLVSTPDDFGHLGAQPAHPELLDYLARQFIAEGWSTRQLVRRLVLSQAFRQSSVVSALARQRDPENRLLHHYPTRRLEAESIRDALLAVAGRMDPTLYGRPIDPPRMSEDKVNKRLFSGPLDGHGRRSIYLRLSIMEPPRFLVGFNLPDLKLPTGRRDVTNVPTQALTLLNDPLVHELARQWGTRLAGARPTSVEARLGEMFITAFGRVPEPGELDRWRAVLHDFATGSSTDILQDAIAWRRLALTFFNAKEFIYYR